MARSEEMAARVDLVAEMIRGGVDDEDKYEAKGARIWQRSRQRSSEEK